MRVLVDTSVWIDHLRYGNRVLQSLLEQGRVLTHPFVIGELAMGSIKQRDVVLDALQNLPFASAARNEEVLRFIDGQRLYGQGVGYMDTHLLAAVRLTPEALLWTLDRRLLEIGEKLGLVFVPA